MSNNQPPSRNQSTGRRHVRNVFLVLLSLVLLIAIFLFLGPCRWN